MDGFNYLTVLALAEAEEVRKQKVVEETVTGANPQITGAANTLYKCGTVSTLSFTPAATGICEVIFTSGATAAVLTLPNTVMMPEWWTGCESNMIYDVSIMDGVYGTVMMWPLT